MRRGNPKKNESGVKQKTSEEPERSKVAASSRKLSPDTPVGATISSDSFSYRNTSIHSDNFYQLPADHDVTFLGVINPVNPTVHDELVMHYVLSIENVGRLFTAGSHYFHLSEKTQPYFFTTAYALSISTDDYENITCDVIDTEFENRVGDGAFGTVNPVVGSIKLRYATTAGLIFSPGSQKSVVKIGAEKFVEGDEYIQSIVTEYDRAHKATHLRVRPPTFYLPVDPTKRYNNKILSCLPMRKMEGKQLFTYIQNPSKYPLTLDDRYQISIALFNQLAKQIHDRNIVHCDIKPENILVYKNEGRWQVNIVDVNLSLDSEGWHAKDIGTAAYLAKENHITADRDHENQGYYSSHSDVFAMSLITALLWKDKKQFSILIQNEKNAVLRDRDEAAWKIKFDMFDGMKKLPLACQEGIVTLLTRCTDIDGQARPSATDCALELAMQYLNFKKETLRIPTGNHRAADLGFTSGIVARKLLTQFFDPETNAPYTINVASSEELKHGLLNEIAQLPDNTFAISEFVFMAKVDAFNTIANKEGLTLVTNNIIDNFWLEYNKIQDLFDSLSTLQTEFITPTNDTTTSSQLYAGQLQQYREGVVLFLNKILQTTINLDEISSATAHMQRKNIKIDAAKSYFRALLEKESNVDKNTPHI